MHSSLKLLPQDFNVVEVWALTEPLQQHDSFLIHRFCCKFAAVLQTIVLSLSFIWCTDGLTFDFKILWYKEDYMLKSSTLHHHT